MNFEDFSRKSGFKILSTAKLNSCEYSLVLYLINCSLSGLDQVISTEAELASLVGYDDMALSACLENLQNRRIIKLRYKSGQNIEHPSLSVGFDFDVSRWKLDFATDVSSQDAIVFPFRRREGAALHLVENGHSDNPEEKKATWTRVFSSFTNGRSLNEQEKEEARESARVLVETHPVDQILLMIRHFSLRIPTLSLLASSWQHYQEKFEEETQRVDLLDARQKHLELDLQLRETAKHVMERAEDLELTEEERTVLQILIKHRHPRRQLFWAYQTRNRYPNLGGFFADNAAIMLAVTSSGAVVKKGSHISEDSED